MAEMKFQIYRGDPEGGKLQDYTVDVDDGMVVLDVVHRIQAEQANDLAVRWNCKAGKCGSCSAEINGLPRLLCMTRVEDLPTDKPIVVTPMKTFPIIKDLVTDVSWNYEVNKRIQPFTPAPNTKWLMKQADVERAQEFRKCIECFLCQDICHILRDHELKNEFIGPRYMVRAASLEMHPLDTADRLPFLQESGGAAYCNITKCCTEVCPEHIVITDNAIIPLKERLVDRFYDPLRILWRKLTGRY